MFVCIVNLYSDARLNYTEICMVKFPRLSSILLLPLHNFNLPVPLSVAIVECSLHLVLISSVNTRNGQRSFALEIPDPRGIYVNLSASYLATGALDKTQTHVRGMGYRCQNFLRLWPLIKWILWFVIHFVYSFWRGYCYSAFGNLFW